MEKEEEYKKEEYKKEEFKLKTDERLNFICENCGEYNELLVDVIVRGEHYEKGEI